MNRKLKIFWHRISNLDRLSYMMNVAFGLSLLMVSIAFITGNQIGENSKLISVIEILVSLGLIALGIERLKHYKKRRQIRIIKDSYPDRRF